MSVAEPNRATPEVESYSLETLLTSDVAAMRSSWQFAAIIQFCRMFAASLKLRGFSADLLESAMLDPDDHRVFLSELLYKLLRPDASQGFSEGDAAAWEHLLRRKLQAQWHDAFDVHPLTQNGFFEAAPMTRVRRSGLRCPVCASPSGRWAFEPPWLTPTPVQVRLLYALCEWRAQECPVVRDAIRRVVRLCIVFLRSAARTCEHQVTHRDHAHR